MKEIEELIKDNKETLEKELNRIKSIVADLRFGSTILRYQIIREMFCSIFWTYLIWFLTRMSLKNAPNIDVKKEIKTRIDQYAKAKSVDLKRKLMSLVKLLINLYVSGVKPENMVIRKLPVIPPDLRPVVQLDWWRFASSDVNLYYRRVLMRNIRLKKMIQVGILM